MNHKLFDKVLTNDGVNCIPADFGSLSEHFARARTLVVDVGLGILDDNDVAPLKVVIDFFCILALSDARVALLKRDEQVLRAVRVEVAIDFKWLVHALQVVDVIDNGIRCIVQGMESVS